MSPPGNSAGGYGWEVLMRLDGIVQRYCEIYDQVKANPEVFEDHVTELERLSSQVPDTKEAKERVLSLPIEVLHKIKWLTNVYIAYCEKFSRMPGLYLMERLKDD